MLLQKRFLLKFVAQEQAVVAVKTVMKHVLKTEVCALRNEKHP